MNNRDKIYVRLESLYKKHKVLDDKIKLCYSNFTKDEEIRKLKSDKLQIKDEIYNLENQLKE